MIILVHLVTYDRIGSRVALADELYDHGLLIIGDSQYCRKRIADLQNWGV
jgi:hypothetical protein